MEIIEKLRSLGISLHANGQNIDIKSPKDALTPEIIAEIKLNKTQLLNLLSMKAAIKKAPEQKEYPVSDSQYRLWILSNIEHPSLYTISAHRELHIESEEDFKKAIYLVTERHESLRTIFKQNSSGELKQIVLPVSSFPFNVETYDIAGYNLADQEIFIQKKIKEISNIPFDLEKGPLIRVLLCKTGDHKFSLYYQMHHIISDGWSMKLLERDIFEYYHSLIEGRACSLEPLAVQYKDYTLWQLESLENGNFDDHKKYWKEKFAGELPILNLPAISENAGNSTGGYCLETSLDEETVARLYDFCRERKGSLFVGLLTVWKTLLYHYTSQKDIIIGIPVSGRVHHELEDQVGFYVNTLPIRNILDTSKGFSGLYDEINTSFQEASRHQVYPFSNILHDLNNTGRDDKRNSLFDVFFTLDSYEKKEEYLNDSFVKENEIQDKGYRLVKFGLEVSFKENEQNIGFSVSYNHDLYNKEQIVSLIDYFKQILYTVLSFPETPVEEINIHTPVQYNQLVYGFNNTDSDYPKDKTIVDTFREQVQRNPQHPAVIYEDRKLSYHELDVLSDELCKAFIYQYKISPHSLIGVKLDRSEWVIVAFLAALKSRCTYVPIDPSYPQERIAFIEENSGCSIIVDETFINEFIAVKDQFSAISVPDQTEVLSTDAAYVIYTSGSTGNPKGVVCTHGNVISLVKPGIPMDITTKDILFATGSPSFDITTFEYYGALLNGATLLISPQKALFNLDLMEEIIKKYQVSIVHFIPSILNRIVEQNIKLLEGVQKLLTGGDQVSAAQVNIVMKHYPDMEVYHAYGPTESTTFSTLYHVKKQYTIIPIGAPFFNRKIYILNEKGNPVPIGVIGEIYVGGEGVAKGYLGRNDLTEERFFDNPFLPSERMYKTGDLGVWQKEGTVLFKGRNDDQIKIHGYRVEISEIESRLNQHPMIDGAVVVAKRNENNEHDSLIAFIKKKQKLRWTPSLAEYFIYDDVSYYSLTNDEKRNTHYKKVFNKYLKDKVVVDIGTGADAILSRFCIEAGASKVYAIEILEESYRKASEKVAELGLQDKIIVIHGASHLVELPEKADFCVSEIVGSIGGAEGAAKIINDSHRFVKSAENIIPKRSLTKIAAVSLPDDSHDFFLDSQSTYYIDRIFDQIGRKFDLRMGIENFSKEYIISNDQPFEDLNFTEKVELELTHQVQFLINQDADCTGFIVWLTLNIDDDEIIDTLTDEYIWKPIYIPLPFEKMAVKKGDIIKADIERIVQNGINPDFIIKGSIHRGNQLLDQFVTVSYNTDEHYKNVPFYDHLFDTNKYNDLSSENLRAFLAEALPAYMIPNKFIEITDFPTTANDKIDRKKLLSLEISKKKDIVDHTIPFTLFEEILKNAWEEVLKCKEVSLNDNFFELGGDSIKAIQITSLIKQKGYVLKVEDILKNAYLSPIAKCIKENKRNTDQSEVVGEIPLSPIQKFFFESDFIVNKNYFHQSLLLKWKEEVDSLTLKKAFTHLAGHHDALRMVYTYEDNTWRQYNLEIKGLEDNLPLYEYDLREYSKEQQLEKLYEIGSELHTSFHITSGFLFKIAHFRMSDGDRVLLVVHHLLIDGVSWRVLLEDLNTLYQSLRKGKVPALPLKTDSFKKWSNALIQHVQNKEVQDERLFWEKITHQNTASLPADKIGTRQLNLLSEMQSLTLNGEYSRKLKGNVHTKYNTEINDILLTALALAVKETFGVTETVIRMEGHGRENMLSEMDVSRTVGWFTSMYPFLLGIPDENSAIETSLIHIKESVRKIPKKGVHYNLLKYLDPVSLKEPQASIQYNFLGEFDDYKSQDSHVFDLSFENTGSPIDKANRGSDVALDVSGVIINGKLETSIKYSDHLYHSETIKKLIDAYDKKVKEIIDFLDQTQTKQITPSDLTYRHLSYETLKNINIGNNIEDIYPLSPLQEGMFYHWSATKDSATHFEQLSYRLEVKGITVEAIGKAFEALVARHAILRTSFTDSIDDKLLQIVHKKVPSTFSCIHPPSAVNEIEAFIEATKKQDILQGFDLEKPASIRLTIIPLDNKEFEFIWSNHHILMDGWCLSILIKDFYDFLLTPEDLKIQPSVPYSDYINWLSHKDMTASEDYWKDYLTNAEETRLPAQLNSKVSEEDAIHGNSSLMVEKKLYDKINNYCHTNLITHNTFFQGVWGYLLSRYNNNADVIFGSVVSGRPSELESAQDIVGLFINTIPVRVQYEADDSVADFLQKIHQDAIASLPHHYTSLATIQANTALRDKLISSLMIFENYLSQEISNTEIGKKALTVKKMDSFEQTNYNFNVTIVPLESSVKVRFNYNSSLFETEFIEEMISHFSAVLEVFCNDSETMLKNIDYLGTDEKKQLLASDQVAIPYPKNKTILDLFEEQVSKTPGQVAVFTQNHSLTYTELNDKANKLAHYLISNHHINPGNKIGVHIEGNENMVIASLAIFKAGGIYVPVSLNYPDSRRTYIIENSGCKMVIDETVMQQYNIDGAEVGNINLSSTNIPACIIYTSGSTGLPKGVMLGSAGLINRLQWMWETYPFEDHEICCSKTSIGFVDHICELFSPLLKGVPLCIYQKEEVIDIPLFIQRLSEDRITRLLVVPSLLRSILNEDEAAQKLKDIKVWVTSGEELSFELVNRFYKTFEKGNRLINIYGSTEVTADATFYDTYEDFALLHQYSSEPIPVPIGKPIHNTQVLVLDQWMKPVPYGITGEIYVGGDCLSSGYIISHDNESKFIKNEEYNNTLYKTGDLGKIRRDGNIEYVGRADDQVKIRGHRIELAEVEKGMKQNSGVEEVALVLTKSDDTTEIIAFYTSNIDLEPQKLRIFLKTELPEYMIPYQFVKIDQIPLNTSGKTDKQALLAMYDTLKNEEPVIDEVATEIEERIKKIWQDVLGLKAISTKDNFFELGGHSIKAMKILSKINKEFDLDITIKSVFNFPTIQDLAIFLEFIQKQKEVKENEGYFNEIEI
ncbi:amino acid adenylation domain-containing protein [Chryseobacterium indologenes]|uniref:non-ribosomal peptide synthetase n=1 Tax=Chryseobacterium indologenes TaxID=253 RepID=UPI0025770240|nr:non-ribosomal peptide synthetase [Chryseobacterium indologenes]MDM1553026.1 amino acid adenylation domain-containing protein [Chryseobacterium indologenes]